MMIVFWSCQPTSLGENQVSKIGTKSFKWHDTEREDEYYGGFRLINVQTWYPADSNESTNLTVLKIVES